MDLTRKGRLICELPSGFVLRRCEDRYGIFASRSWHKNTVFSSESDQYRMDVSGCADVDVSLVKGPSDGKSDDSVRVVSWIYFVQTDDETTGLSNVFLKMFSQQQFHSVVLSNIEVGDEIVARLVDSAPRDFTELAPDIIKGMRPQRSSTPLSRRICQPDSGIGVSDSSGARTPEGSALLMKNISVSRVDDGSEKTSLSNGESPVKKRRTRTMLPCAICRKEFDRPSLLKRHMRTHTGEKPHECDYCGKAFSTSSSLNTHRRIHSGERPHVCPICNKRFTASSNLYYHRMTHNKVKPHKCKLCTKSFPTPGDLRSHMYSHTGSWPFNCDVCKRGFSKQTNLRNHALLHTGERPHRCEFCNKKFALMCNLRTHLKTHEGEPKGKCAQCGKTTKGRAVGGPGFVTLCKSCSPSRPVVSSGVAINERPGRLGPKTATSPVKVNFHSIADLAISDTPYQKSSESAIKKASNHLHTNEPSGVPPAHLDMNPAAQMYSTPSHQSLPGFYQTPNLPHNSLASATTSSHHQPQIIPGLNPGFSESFPVACLANLIGNYSYPLNYQSHPFPLPNVSPNPMPQSNPNPPRFRTSGRSAFCSFQGMNQNFPWNGPF